MYPFYFYQLWGLLNPIISSDFLSMSWQILNENCLKTLQDYQVQKVKFDYVINDLSEYLIDTDTGKCIDNEAKY